jgi:hypothetical protein
MRVDLDEVVRRGKVDDLIGKVTLRAKAFEFSGQPKRGETDIRAAIRRYTQFVLDGSGRQRL